MSDITVVVEPPEVITVTLAVGQGPAGPPGNSGDVYQHTQSVAASTWTINHNFGYRPNIALATLGGAEIWGEVLHVSVNQAQAIFDSSITGLAICS